MQSLFENQEPKRHSPILWLLPAVMGVVVLVGIWVTHRAHVRQQETQARVASHDLGVRQLLREAVVQISTLKAEMDAVNQERLNILREIKPRRIAGIEIPQPLSKKQKEQYEEVSHRLSEITARYRVFADAFNESLKAYTGPWPESESPKPTPFPLPEDR